MAKIRLAIFSLLLLCLSFSHSFGQNPYELELKKDMILFGGGALGQVGSIFVAVELDGLSEEELNLLDPNKINSFDRRTVNYYSLRHQDYSDVLLTGSYFFPALFLIDKRGREGFLEIGTLSMQSFLLNSSITSIVKLSAQRTRPLAYNPNVPLDKRKSSSAKLSFYSGHTSAVSTMSFFTAKVFSDYYPNSKWKPVVWSVAAVIPAATGYFRVRGGKHFPTDVITGYLAGAIIGITVPHIHKKKDPNQKMSFSISSGTNALGLTMTF